MGGRGYKNCCVQKSFSRKFQIVLKEITEFFAFYMKTMLSVETCVISYLSGHVLGSPETLLQGRDQVPHRHDEARLHRRVRGCR